MTRTYLKYAAAVAALGVSSVLLLILAEKLRRAT